MDNITTPEILTLKEAAQFLKVSQWWLYRNWEKVGGRRLAGKILFPGRTELYEYLFNKAEKKKTDGNSRMEVRLLPEGDKVSKPGIQNKGRSAKGRAKEKSGAEDNKRTDRHNLFGAR